MNVKVARDAVLSSEVLKTPVKSVLCDDGYMKLILPPVFPVDAATVSELCSRERGERGGERWKYQHRAKAVPDSWQAAAVFVLPGIS